MSGHGWWSLGVLDARHGRHSQLNRQGGPSLSQHLQATLPQHLTMTLTPERNWHVTVVRAHGLRLMRPEKRWRPIIQMEIDTHYRYETILGCDGQNVNMTEAFSFEDADANSLLDIRIFHQSQTKKKGKRKKEVAATIGHPLGRLVKTQTLDRKLELRLQCRLQNKNASGSGGRPQNGASVVLRIQPPPLFASSSQFQEEIEGKVSPTYTSDSESSHILNDALPTPEDSPPLSSVPHTPPQTLRRRVKGYQISSDEELCSSGGEEEENARGPMSFAQVVHEFDQDTLPIPIPSQTRLIEPFTPIDSWISASILPVHVETITVPPSYMNSTERVLSSFTLYSELKEAAEESEYQIIFERLQREWQYMGGLLVSLAAVNTAVFAISPHSLFQIHPYAQIAIAVSGIASGLGIATDAWFLLRYNWIDLKTFIYRARDVYGSYFFFAICSRMPVICMSVSAIALTAFLGFVAFEIWPLGVSVVCFCVGIIMTLQFLVFGVHWGINKIIGWGRAIKEVAMVVIRRLTRTSVVTTS